MTPKPSALQSYAASWKLRRIFLPVYLAMRLVTYAILIPFVGGVVGLSVSLSDQSALTDQDIARFILTPIGFAATLVVASVLLIGEVVNFAVMTGVIHTDERSPWLALRMSLASVWRRRTALFLFAINFVLRVLSICLPFVLAGLFVAQRYLTEFDINYYLSEKPADFFVAVGLIAPILLVLAWVLLSCLTRWAISLHFVLFAKTKSQDAFAKSSEAMKAERVSLILKCVSWVIIRLALFMILSLTLALVMRLIPLSMETSFSLVMGLLLIFMILYTLAGIVLSGVSLGALAIMLDAYFRDTPEHTDLQQNAEVFGPVLRHPVLSIAVVLALVAGAIASGSALLENIKTEDNVEVIAHRGAAGARPENTMASVIKAIEDKADWVEIDVQETVDGEIVVIHDSDFMKIAGVPTKIWDATLQDVGEIDIGSWFDPAYASERAPLLKDVLETAKGKSKVLIELKYYGHDQDLENRVAAIVEETGMQDQIATMSLKYPAVQKMRGLRPDWPSGVLAASAVGDLAGLHADFIAISKKFASPKLVESTDAAGKALYVWTVNDPLEMSKMMSMGVDGIITDEPELAHKVLDFRATLSTPQRLLLWLSETMGLSLNTKEYRDNQP